jgi:hypothetical protein
MFSFLFGVLVLRSAAPVALHRRHDRFAGLLPYQRVASGRRFGDLPAQLIVDVE